MRRGIRFRAGLLVTGAAMLAASCSSPASTKPSATANGSAAPVSGTLIVNGAGTLAKPFGQIIDAFSKQNPDVTVHSKFAGSVGLVRGITELQQPVDVLGVADYSLIPAQMFGRNTHSRFADWYVGFVSNRITFAYTDHSAGSADLTAQNWYKVLSRPGVHIGRSDPDTDPSGYQVLQMLDLAQKYYHAPKLSAGVLANSPRGALVGTETQLLPAVASGQIDYLGIYRSDALQHGLRFIDLPSQVDLSDPGQAAAYGAVSVKTSSGPRAGRPIVYALTVPTDANNAAAGVRFVQFVLSPAGQKIMSDNGFTVVSPAVAGGRKLPAALKSLTKPATLPGG